MTSSAPTRVLLFCLLLIGLILISTGLCSQMLRLGSMLLAVSTTTEAPAAAELPPITDQTVVKNSATSSEIPILLTPAGRRMEAFNPAVSFFKFLLTAALVFWVVARWLRTPIILRGEFLKTMFLYEALMVGVIVVLFPFFWMVCTSFKPSGTELKINISNPFDVVPTNPTLNNFKKVLKIEPGNTASDAKPQNKEDAEEQKKNFGTYFLNSLIVASTAAFFVTLFASMAGYVFAKKELPYKSTMFGIFMATMMIPGMMFMVPQFFMICKMGLFGTKWAMFLPHLASVFGVFMLKQFMETIPSSLIEAARIDGASEWQIFRIVIIPLSMPILLTLFLLTFLFHWSNFLWQLIVTDFQEPLSITLPVALSLFRGQYTSDLGLIMSASCFSVVPIVILFLIAQRYFIEGMTQGAVKE
ncbi:MAG: carbohydrate ABC transporter permease [Candidatus Riflebacteria bacterium]|nr:carbohydrate ABC transporter permease [Candidatus Riflebacteria bacterium]